MVGPAGRPTSAGPSLPRPDSGGDFLLSSYAVNQTIAAWNDTVYPGISPLATNGNPEQMAVDDPAGLLFVTGGSGSNVSVLNIAERKETRMVYFPGATGVSSLAFDPSNSILYGTSPSQGKIFEMNVSSGFSASTAVTFSGASWIALDENGSDLIVLSGGGGQAALLDPSTNTLVATYPTGASPSSAIQPAGLQTLLVTDQGSALVTAINLTSGSTKSIGLGAYPNVIAYDAANGLAYISTENTFNVTILNPATGRTAGSLNIGATFGQYSSTIAYDPVDADLYLLGYNNSNSDGNPTFLVIGGVNNTTFRWIDLSGYIHDVLVDPVTGDVFDTAWSMYGVYTLSPDGSSWGVLLDLYPSFVASLPSGRLAVGDLDEGTGTVVNESGEGSPGVTSIGAEDAGGVYAPQTNELYLASYGGAVWAVNAANLTITDSRGGGFWLTGLAYDPTTNLVFTSSLRNDNISVFNGTTMAFVHSFVVPGAWYNIQLYGMAVDPSDQLLFVGEAGGVLVYNTSTFTSLGTLSLPYGGYVGTVTYDPGDGFVYCEAGSGYGGSLYRIDPRTLTITSDVGLGSVGAAFATAYSPITGDLYDALVSNHSVTVINPDLGTIVQNVTIAPPGYAAWGVAVDASTGEVYAAVPNDDSLVGFNTVSGSPPSVAAFTATPEAAYLNASITLTAQVTGGAAPYTYLYTGLPPGCATANASRLVCSPTAAANYSVRLEVVDADGVSTNATTDLSIGAAQSLVIHAFTANRYTLDLNGSTTLYVNETSTALPVTIQYLGLPAGCASADVTILFCQPTGLGTSVVTVNVQGPRGLSANASLTLLVLADPTVSAVALTEPIVDVGQPFTATVGVMINVGGFTLAWVGLPSGCVAPAPNATAVTCTPTGTGIYSLSATVTDDRGVSATSAVTTLQVVPDPTVSAPVLTHPAVDVGQVFGVHVTSTAAVVRSVLWSSLPSGCAPPAASLSFTCTPTGPGSFSIAATVTDGQGFAVTSAVSALVVDPALVAAVPEAAPISLVVNESFTLTETVTGGGGGLRVVWSGLPSSCALLSGSWNETCSVPAPASYQVSVTVTDRNGASSSSPSLNITVAAAPSGGSHSTVSPGGSVAATTWEFLAAAVAVVAVVVAVLLLLRRRRGAPPGARSEAMPPTGGENPAVEPDGSGEGPDLP